MRLTLAAISLCLLLLGTTYPATHAQSINDEKDGPVRLTAGAYLINIGRIDLQTGSYDLDFYFWLSTANPAIDFTKNKPSFDFMNSMNAKVEPNRIEPGYYEVRVKGTFLKNMDFRNYPFDTQQVTIEVEF